MEAIKLIFERLGDAFSYVLVESGSTRISVSAVIELLICLIALWFFTGKMRNLLISKLGANESSEADSNRGLANTIRWISFLVGTMVVATLLEIHKVGSQMLISLGTLLNTPLIHVGKTSITLWSVLYVSALWTLLILLTNRLQRWFAERVLSGAHLDLGLRYATATIVKYVVVALGFIVILQSAGVDLSALTVLAGAIGLGLSFGLQNITSNVVSGLIVLFERPIKVGDRIEVDGIVGEVQNIALRATVVRTNDNIEIIIPNSEFISHSVTNWSHSNRDIRVGIPVGVSYSADPELVSKVLIEAAAAHPGVLAEPEPLVIFEGFGDSSLNFVLRVFTRDYVTKPGILRSDLYFAIFQKFKQNSIEIPFPQRDLHIRSDLGAALVTAMRTVSRENGNDETTPVRPDGDSQSVYRESCKT